LQGRAKTETFRVLNKELDLSAIRNLPAVIEEKRFTSPAPTPQALAWHNGKLWMGSRDLRRVYEIDAATWTVSQEIEPPGIPWAAVSTGKTIRFTIGEGTEDDRYIRRYHPATGFEIEQESDRIACPDFTGSYLSHDGENLYLSQWYKGRILKLDATGNILRAIEVGGEVSGHVFVDGTIYVLRGTEQDGEAWALARLNPKEETPQVEDVAQMTFACRSLTFDGAHFWSNHRAGGEIVQFSLPT
jgi:outer membrane protein assembly factor BamB